MQKYNCLVVEDEPLAADVLEDYIKQTNFLELTAKCSDAIFAMELLQTKKIDLIFLDIHLPKLKGIDFIKAIKDPPPIIITSAYQEYALQGYELSVIDYLLKPIEFNRFLTAVSKLTLKTTAAFEAMNSTPIERASLFLNVSKKKVRVFIDEILYIESMKEYIKIITPKKSILTKLPLSEIEGLLAKNDFLRIHRSFIVAKNKIEAFSTTDIEIEGKQIPIGRSYKDQVLAALQ